MDHQLPAQASAAEGVEATPSKNSEEPMIASKISEATIATTPFKIPATPSPTSLGGASTPIDDSTLISSTELEILDEPPKEVNSAAPGHTATAAGETELHRALAALTTL